MSKHCLQRVFIVFACGYEVCLEWCEKTIISNVFMYVTTKIATEVKRVISNSCNRKLLVNGQAEKTSYALYVKRYINMLVE